MLSTAYKFAAYAHEVLGKEWLIPGRKHKTPACIVSYNPELHAYRSAEENGTEIALITPGFERISAGRTIAAAAERERPLRVWRDLDT